MPQSALTAEVVDYSLSVPQLTQELIRLAKHPYTLGRAQEPLSDPKDQQDLQKVYVLLRTAAGVDYSEYKSPTIKRRLARRMALLKVNNLSDYVKLLQNDPKEIKILAADVLIHVTSFFRDPDVFKKLKSDIFPEIIKNKPLGTPIRVWVTGCSSGEEVYSIAIALLEFLEDRSSKYPVQIFGSDISERMIEKARAGVYVESLLRDIDLEKLRRFFVKTENGYRINKLVRDLCIFVRHDLAQDPPFSKLDLVTCRNVLIYFEPELQKRIISTFHYCLNHLGFLLLGRTENISGPHRLFIVKDKTNKIFSRAAVTSQLQFATMQNTGTEKPSLPRMISDPGQAAFDVNKQMDHLLLSEYAPAGVVINERHEVIQYRGRTGIYLEAPPGHPQLNLLKMVREGLFTPLRTALEQAKKKMAVIRKEGLQFIQNGVSRTCNLVVMPVSRVTDLKESLFLVLFEEVQEAPARKKGKQKKLNETQNAEKLGKELRNTQEYLQSLNEEHQKTNDILNTMNEELVSGNEELQSMNEELETSKEELQSTNEELTTVNDELQNRNQETAQINDDLLNLLHSVDIPILILDLNRRIRRFTPQARTILNLLPTDIGRQINDIKPNILIDDLDQRIQEVIETVATHESEVQDQNGRWHRLQIRPYKTTDHKITGAVLSLINIDMLRRAVNDAEWMRDYSTSIVEAVQIPLLVLNHHIQVISANQAFYDDFKVSKSETEGKDLYELQKGRWNIKSLRKALDEMIEKKTSFLNTEVTWVDQDQGKRTMSLSARSTHFHDGQPMILFVIEDITDRKNMEKDRQELLQQTQGAKDDAERANQTKDQFLATLSHELRTPLTSLILQSQLLRRGTLNEDRVKSASLAIERAAKTQTQLIEDLMDISRIVTGKLKMELSPVNINEIIHSAIETVSALAESKSIQIKAHTDESVGLVSGDPVRLQQVIWNLLTNAIKFTAKGGKVQITLKEIDGKALIQVIDAGIGISAEFLPHVFKRFSQAEGTITRTHGGLGLGLAIVLHLVEMHGGTVLVESEGKNKGSTFTVTLPLIPRALEKASNKKSNSSAVNKAQKQRIKLKGIKILVVEDDPEVREALKQILNHAGAEVQTAVSAADAMRILESFSPDEMILDISMPEEDGYSLLRRIRKREGPHGKKIPAMALTALASDKDRERAFSAGFQMHLSKPVDIDSLTGAVLRLKEDPSSNLH